jgi:DNA-binding response OmpR family regulator
MLPLPHTILVVENDEPLAALLQEVLEDEGYQVQRASNGRHADTRIQANDLDAVLLDLRIPLLDGLHVLKMVRASERLTTRHLPIMVLSGAASELEHRACRAAGADDYLAKPFDLDDLLARLQSLLNQRRATDELPISADAEMTAL